MLARMRYAVREISRMIVVHASQHHDRLLLVCQQHWMLEARTDFVSICVSLNRYNANISGRLDAARRIFMPTHLEYSLVAMTVCKISCKWSVMVHACLWNPKQGPENHTWSRRGLQCPQLKILDISSSMNGCFQVPHSRLGFFLWFYSGYIYSFTYSL